MGWAHPLGSHKLCSCLAGWWYNERAPRRHIPHQRETNEALKPTQTDSVVVFLLALVRQEKKLL